MKAILRSAIVAAGMASAIVMTTTPASAQTAVAFVGEATLSCFGCGTVTTGNSAKLWATGVVDGETVSAVYGVTANNGSANGFTIEEPPGDPNCVVSGSANGTVTVGSKSTTFDWTRVGAVAVITTGVGTGAAAFAVTDPLGSSPCGRGVKATFAGALAGA